MDIRGSHMIRQRVIHTKMCMTLLKLPPAVLIESCISIDISYRRREYSVDPPLRVILSVCLSVCTIKPKRLKLKSPNLAQGYL